MKLVSMALASAAALCVLTGCNSYMARFSPPIEQEATVVLRENDFQYLERDLKGDYHYWSIFGAIPLGDPRLYSNALADLYSNAQASTEGKPAQLVNWKYDEDNLSFFIVVKRRAIFRADLIEYTK